MELIWPCYAGTCLSLEKAGASWTVLESYLQRFAPTCPGSKQRFNDMCSWQVVGLSVSSLSASSLLAFVRVPVQLGWGLGSTGWGREGRPGGESCYVREVTDVGFFDHLSCNLTPSPVLSLSSWTPSPPILQRPPLCLGSAGSHMEFVSGSAQSSDGGRLLN